jgi:hypothetical protein
MKKILLLLSAISLGMVANAQSLTFTDLLYLKTQKTASNFLIPKGFIHSDLNSSVMEVYFKNQGTDKQEKAEFNLHKNKAFIVYQTADTTYLHTMIKQLYKRYRLILKDDGKDETYYRFGNFSIDIMVDIYNQPGRGSRISVSPFQ